MKLLILISLCYLLPLQAAQYQEMQFKPIHIRNNNFNELEAGRTYNYHQKSRILAAKDTRIPVLEQFENLLFPHKDFKKDQAKQRLERIEIAVHGNIQQGSIKYRLNLLENEITAWQIANYQTLEILNDNKNEAHAFQKPQKQVRAKTLQPRTQYYPRAQTQEKKIDYDYQNYKLISPIFRDISRRSVRAIFDL